MRWVVLALVVPLGACDVVFGIRGLPELPGNFAQIVAGDHVTCAVTKSNDLYCWGYNGSGQLGVGAPDRQLDTPTLVGSNFSQVATGHAHACGLHTDGFLACWGDDSHGQLGTSDTMSTTSPTPANNVPRALFSTVAAFADHTCAIASDATLWCWGANTSGQANPASNDVNATPAQILPVQTWQAVAPGVNHTCAITTDQTLWCWGANDKGQCGFASSDPVITPTQIDGTYVAVSSGADFSCALDTDQHVTCWGVNRAGELGRATTSLFETSPAPASNEPYTAISAGWTSACGLTAQHSIECWGDLTGIHDPASAPTEVFPSGGWAAVVVGRTHACTLDTGGHLFCAGDNTSGQLTGDVSTPTTVPVPITDGVDSVAVGELSTCANKGTILSCWGDNASGQLSTDDFTRRLEPTPVSNGASFRTIALGGDHACGINAAGVMFCWGGNEHGAIGDGTTVDRTKPTLQAGARFTYAGHVALGNQHSCAVAVGDLAPHGECWGRGTEGQLVNATTSDALTPASMTQAGSVGQTVNAIAAGSEFTCWVINAKAYCVGLDDQNQTADSDASSTISVGHGSLLDVVNDIAAGHAHACVRAGAATTDIACWGRNVEGELGIGVTSASEKAFTTVTAPTHFISVVAGAYHTCGLTGDAHVMCWGKNDRGQLGDGTTTDNPQPKVVPGLEGVTSIAAGGATTCAIAGSGKSLSCWGDNGFGAVGVKSGWVQELVAIGFSQ